jgi:hypothetical protein
MAVCPVGLKSKNGCAGKGQQQFTQLPDHDNLPNPATDRQDHYQLSAVSLQALRTQATEHGSSRENSSAGSRYKAMSMSRQQKENTWNELEIFVDCVEQWKHCNCS